MAFILPSDTEPDEPPKQAAPPSAKFRLPSDIDEENQAATAAPTRGGQGSILAQMAEDIPSEAGKSLSTNVGGLAERLNPVNRAEKGVIGGTLEAGKGILHGLATVPDVLQSPLRSIIGHPMAAAENWTGHAIGKSLEYWFPGTAAGELGKRIAATAEAENPREHYEKSAENVSTALQAARPSGFTPGVKTFPQGKISGPPKPVTPLQTDQLYNLADNLYGTARQSGVAIKPIAVQNAVKNIIGEMRAEGYRDVPHSGHSAFSMLQKLVEEPDLINTVTGAHDVGGVHSIMKGLRRIAHSMRGKSEGDAALMAMHGLRDFMYDLPNNPNNVMMGHANVARSMEDLQRATSIWHIASKADTVETAIKNALDRAATGGSGANIENAIRQEIRAILKNPGQRRGFKPDEIRALNAIVHSDKTGDTLRLLGKLAPTGVISGLGGLEIGNLIGLAGWKKLLPSITGHIARKASEARKIAKAEYAGELIRSKVTKGVTTRLPPNLEFTKKRLFDPRVMAPFLSQFQRDDQKQPFLKDAQGNEYP